MRNVDSFPEPVYITRPLLPDIDAVAEIITQIWDSGQLTNNGNMVCRLEIELANYLRANYLSLFSNGTVALQIACKTLGLSGEVITTPFTFAATAHALDWCNIKPVFCDIENETFNIDPKKIEALITPKTTAIMPVHVFGNPCRVEEIQNIATKNGLKIIYDAAHAFGVEVNGGPICSFGDISMFSLHATKVYHTIEGGALVFKDSMMKKRADALRNFGIASDGDIEEVGTNGKLNEVQAGIGILVLKLVQQEVEARKRITNLYRAQLKGVPGITFIKDIEGVKHNYPYFVIKIDKQYFGKTRDEVYEKLREYNVFARKYFYPLCSRFTCYSSLPSAAHDNLVVAERVADEVLALPLHGKISEDYVGRICNIIGKIRGES